MDCIDLYQIILPYALIFNFSASVKSVVIATKQDLTLKKSQFVMFEETSLQKKPDKY